MEPDKDAQTITQFCRSNGISRQFFYDLRKIGKGPDLMEMGAKKLISKEASKRWRAERERDPLSTIKPSVAA